MSKSNINLGRLDEEARCEVMMELEESGRAVGSLRQILAVVAMVNEDIGDKAVKCAGVEKPVRRSVVKQMNSRGKRKKRLPAAMGEAYTLLYGVSQGGREGNGDAVRVVLYGGQET